MTPNIIHSLIHKVLLSARLSYRQAQALIRALQQLTREQKAAKK